MKESILQRVSAFFGVGGNESLYVELADDGKIKFYNSNKKIFNAFFTAITVGTVVAMLAIILYYVYAFASLYNGSTKFDWLLGIFSDFVVIMNFSLEESPYVVGDSSYPPMAIAILYPFALICKDVFAKFEFGEMTADELTAEVIVYPQFWVAILLFFAICSILIVLLTSKLFGLRGKNMLKLAIVIMFSAPFIYAVMRGNTIYFALIFLVAFLILKDSKNPALRELSYVLLAFAGAIKLYPLFFGVFLLKDKKIFASIRVAIYFALIFGLSFFIFRNDFGDVSPFIGNLGGFMSNETRLLATNNLSISAQLYKLLHLFVPNLSSDSPVFSIVNYGVMAIAFVFATYAAIVTKNDFSRYAICFAIVVLIPAISYFYIIIFAILPFMEYIRTYGTIEKSKRIFYFFAFMFLFAAFVVIAKNFILHSLIIIAILVIEIASVIKERRRKIA